MTASHAPYASTYNPGPTPQEEAKRLADEAAAEEEKRQKAAEHV